MTTSLPTIATAAARQNGLKRRCSPGTIRPRAICRAPQFRQQSSKNTFLLLTPVTTSHILLELVVMWLTSRWMVMMMVVMVALLMTEHDDGEYRAGCCWLWWWCCCRWTAAGRTWMESRCEVTRTSCVKLVHTPTRGHCTLIMSLEYFFLSFYFWSWINSRVQSVSKTHYIQQNG